MSRTLQQAPEPVAWEGAEEWEQLAWHLCADENGEDACNELIWEGGPIKEPWGERWLKYEDEAKRMIALVRKYAAAVSAAKDAEIAQLRAELIKSLADNAPLREQVRVLEDARPEPDCRTCASSCSMDGRAVCILPRKHCTNGDRYEPLPPVRIWRKV